MTNIFDTVSVEVYSVNSPNRDIQTGDMRLVDLHNRKFYLTAKQQRTQSNPAQLGPGAVQHEHHHGGFVWRFRSSLKSKQVLSLTLDQFDDQLSVRFKYNRHRGMAPAYPIDPYRDLLMTLAPTATIIMERPLRKGDVAAICMNYGRVTRDMLNVWATDLWQMENALAQNPALTNSISPDVYQGTTMYLCGMKYYEKCSEFDAFNANLHKINNISTWAAGLSKISPARDGYGNLDNGGVDPILPNVDMFFYEIGFRRQRHPAARLRTHAADGGAELQYHRTSPIAPPRNTRSSTAFTSRPTLFRRSGCSKWRRVAGQALCPSPLRITPPRGPRCIRAQPLQNWDTNLWSPGDQRASEPRQPTATPRPTSRRGP